MHQNGVHNMGGMEYKRVEKTVLKVFLSMASFRIRSLRSNTILTIWPGVGYIFQMSCFRLVMIFVQTDMNVAHPYSSIVCIVCWFPINSMASWQTSSQKKKSSPFLQDNEWTKWKLLLMITSQFRQLIFHFLSEISSVYYFALLFVIKLLWLQLKHCYTYTLCFLDTSYWILYTSTPTYSYPYMFLH